MQQAERVGGGSRDQHLARSTRPRSRVYEVNAISHALEGTQDMAPLAKRPRRSDDVDASNGVYYDNVPGTSMTRASAGPASSIAAPQHPAYFPAHGPNGVSYTSMGAPVSPLLASEPGARSLAPPTASSMPHGLSQMHSSGTEDNEDMAPPKSSSAQGTRGRGRGRGRARGRGRGRGTSRAAVDHADVSQSYSDAHAFAPSTHDAMLEDDAEPVAEPLVFQCRQCFRLLGDSFAFVATDTELGYVVLSDVSDVVSQDTTFQTSTQPGKDMGATFALLRCGGCKATVGRTYRTTPRHLDDLRDCASLDVDAVTTYRLGSNATLQLEEPPSPAMGEDEVGSTTVSGDKALEQKMERTRALTIELSDRLIKAEADIRRYSNLVDQLLAARDARLPSTQPAEAAAEARVEASAPPQDAATQVREPTTTPPRVRTAEAEAENEAPPSQSPLKPKQEPDTSRRKSLPPPARATRSSRASNLVVLVDSANNTSLS